MLTYALAFLPVLYVSGFFHELGHAVLGRWNGFVVTSFGMGTARPFWVGRWGSARLYLARGRVFQGFAFSFLPQLYAKRRQMVGMLAGGILAQAALTAGSFALWRWLPWGTDLWFTFLLVNGAGVVVNLFPLTTRVGNFSFQSDGRQILKVLQDGMLPAPAPARVQTVAALRGLWDSVGDRLGLYIHLLGATTAWLELDNVEQAERCWAEAEALGLSLPPAVQPLRSLVRGLLACQRQQAEDSERFFAEAEQQFGALGHDGGRFAVSCARADVLLARGEAGQAAGRLEALAADPVVRARPALQADLLAARLSAAAAAGNAEQVGLLRVAFELGRRSFPSLTRDLRVYRSLARYYAGRGDHAQADAAYQKALGAARRIYEAIHDPGIQTQFLLGQTKFLDEAKAYRLRRGGEAEAAKIDALFLAPEELQRRFVERREARSRRLHRIAWVVSAVNLLAGAAILAYVLRTPVTLREQLGMVQYERKVWFFLGSSLLMYLPFLGLYSLAFVLARRYFPGWRLQAGQIALFLALMPLPSCLVSLFFFE